MLTLMLLRPHHAEVNHRLGRDLARVKADQARKPPELHDADPPLAAFDPRKPLLRKADHTANILLAQAASLPLALQGLSQALISALAFPTEDSPPTRFPGHCSLCTFITYRIKSLALATDFIHFAHSRQDRGTAA